MPVGREILPMIFLLANMTLKMQDAYAASIR